MFVVIYMLILQFSQLNKKRGRRKGSKNKLSPGVTKMLGEASLQYAYGNFEQVISSFMYYFFVHL